jgi:1,4-alpha-glucan branching enzyme
MNMIHQPAPSNRQSARAGVHHPVNFFCVAPDAQHVDLVGDFNQWQPFPMQRTFDGWWLACVELAHGHHQYRFLIDGRPTLDPRAAGFVRDEHGDRASLIAVS